MADYLKIPEVARRLDVSEKTARRYIKSGAIPSTFIGGAYRVTEEDLEAYIHGAEVKPDVPKVTAPPSLFNDLEERREYPYPWMASSLARTIDHWRHVVQEQSRGPAYNRTVSEACFDLIANVVLIEHETGASGEEWRQLPEHEKRERLEVAQEHLEPLARDALARYKASEAAQEAEVRSIERQALAKREQIRERTRELSA